VRFFPEADGVFDYADGLPVKQEENRFTVSAKISPASVGVPDKGIRGLLVAEKGWDGKGQRQGVEIDAPFGGEAAPTDAAGSGPSIALGKAILIALLGGIILNLMPCVFPVISLKILGFVNLAGENPRTVWRHGLLFAAGVMVSFWALAGLLLAVKAANPSLGWAFQFTNPFFVISMCILFLLMGLSLFGVFEIGTTLTSAGSGVQDSHSPMGTFLSGVLATVVATPCVGPFMGVAIGFAMSQPAAVAFIIFTSLGFGMALPYLLLSRFPAWLKAIPRPGPWMESLKQFMGFLLLGFALFLVWVVTDMRGLEGLGRLLPGLLIVGVAAWVYGRWGAISRTTSTRIRSTVIAVVLLVSGGAYAMCPPKSVEWLDYSPELVEQLRSEGKPVFIDFTAAWCVSCQANKKLVLNTKKIQSAFTQNKVSLIKADWTAQQEPITSVLASYGRNGVPLYVLYGNGADAPPQILPELLTKRIVIDALKEL
jgi:thiol:disulfide interchange protein DsbD